jgi:cytochrome b561
MAEVNGYSRAQILLHWGIVLLLIVSYLSSDAMKAAWIAIHEGREAYGNTAAVHVWVGATILVLALLRLVLRFRRGAPPLPEGGHPVTDMTAKVTHIGLYLGIVLIPASGIGAWFGGFDTAGEVHEILFNGLMVLVVLHVVGAVYHQYVLKDGLIRRMMRAE